MRIRWIAWIGLALLAARPAHGAPTDPLRNVSFDQKLGAQLPLDIVVMDEAGNETPLRRFFGSKPVILALVYYQCPMLCTLTLNGLVSALRALSFTAGEEFEIVTLSIDADETPALAAAKKDIYLREYRREAAARGWHFLTAREKSIRAVTDAVGFRYQFVPEKGQFAHAAGIIVLTPKGRVARYFFGVEYAPRDLRLGLVEAAEEKIGNLVDQLLLFCFQYDPRTGKYGPMILKILRLSAGATVLALAGGIIVLRRGERRRGGRPRGV